MSNFTKSILYSTTVLAAGLVAIFAIYNSVTEPSDGFSVSEIAPAAGDSEDTKDYAAAFGKNVYSKASKVKEAATSVVNTTVEIASEVSEVATTVVEGTKSTLKNASSALGEATEPAEDVKMDIIAATLSETSPAEGGEEKDTNGGYINDAQSQINDVIMDDKKRKEAEREAEDNLDQIVDETMDNLPETEQ